MKTLGFPLFFLATLFSSQYIFSQPVITSFAPTSGPVGTTVTITGANFSITPANNVVYFGAVKANVTVATATSLTVTVPSGSTYQPITVSTGGLTGYSARPFIATFSGGGQINSSSFSERIDSTTDLHPNGIIIADFDGDGKPDMATPNNYSTSGQPASVSILRNTSTAAGIAFAQVQNINNGVATYALAGGDIDGDGKQDLVACSIADQKISVFRNTSVTGNISFAPKVDYATNGGTHGISINDIDGDGRPDISVVNAINGIMSVYRNTGSQGAISFAPKIDFTTGLLPESIVTSDFDGDGKADVVVTNNLSNSFSVFRNISTAGNISFNARVDIATGGTNAPNGIAVGDLDGDSKTDVSVVITNSSGVCGTQLYRNTSTTGNISFNYTLTVTGVSGTTAYHTTLGDINGDGKPDIAMSNTGAGLVQVYQNNSTVGTLAFGPPDSFSGIFGPYAVAFGDMNADNKPDLIASEFTLDKVSVYKSQCGSPGVVSFSPLTAGTGATVTITGSNFTGVTSVSFGGIPASSFTVVNATTITAVVGTGASGNVVVTNSAGSGGKSGFQFAGPPVINSFTPTSGFSGTTVTISGLNFNGASTVRFGGTDASSFTVTDPFTIIATVAFGTTGNVSVTAPFGTGSLAGFTYAPVPIIFSFTPTSAATGSTVTISGINFTGTTGVSFGGVAASSFTIVNSNTITAVVGNGASGNVVVTNAFGTNAKSGFTYLPPPTITSFNPLSAGGGTTVVISGTNFSTVSSVKFGGTNANSFNVINSTTINAVVDGNGSSGTVSVTAQGGTATLAGFSFIPAPTITGFSPATTGAGATVTITGTNFTGATAVSFGGVAATSFVVNSGTSITAVVAGGASGQVRVTTLGGFAVANGFDFTTIPVISSFSPASGQVGAAITITGANFSPVASGNTVYFGAVKATVSSATSNVLNVTVPVGANYEFITITTNNRTAYSSIPFAVTYSGGGSFNANSFSGKVDFVANGSPESIASSDLDDDGKPDIVVANTVSNTISLYRNTSISGTLSFAPKIDSATGLYPHAIKFADIDGDGRKDILLVNYDPTSSTQGVPNLITIYRNISTPGNISLSPRFIIATYNHPQDLTIADFNMDGKPDMAITHQGTSISEREFISVFTNNSVSGSISFAQAQYFTTSPSTLAGFFWENSLSVADINNDSKPDLVIGFSNGNFTSVLKNQSIVGSPLMSFQYQCFGGCWYGSEYNYATPADFDGDGLVDILTDSRILRNITTNGILNFGFQSGSGGVISLGNLSGAPKPDFARINPSSNTVSVLRNSSSVGTISFEPAVNYNTSTNPQGVATADYNGDGKVDIATSNADFNTFSVLLNRVGYSGTSITSFSPTNGNSGTLVTITGTNFINITGVSFGGVAASSFTVVNSSTITAIAASGASGNVSVISSSGTTSLGWFYYGPSITSFSPSGAGTGLTVTITGTDFIGTTSVSFGGVAAMSFTVLSSTAIVAKVANGSSGNVSVTTPGGTATMSGFTFVAAPTITSFTPASGGTGTSVAITGTNFNGASVVRFGATSAASFIVLSPTSITAVVGSGSTGNVFVTTAGGTANSINTLFTFIPSPTITSFTPTSGSTGTTITINGTNFTGATAVSFGGVAAQSFTVNSATSITAVVGTGASGNVSVTTPGGTATLPGFTYNIVTAVGNQGNNNSKELTVSPNPGDGLVLIKHPATVKNAQISFIDMIGRLVKEITPLRNTGQTNTDVSRLPQGIYKIIWSDGNRILSRTFMVK